MEKKKQNDVLELYGDEEDLWELKRGDETKAF